MTYIYSDLTMSCSCALNSDARWFLDHPSRSKFLRLPYRCEAAEPQEGVSQVVAVWMDISVNDYIKGGKTLVHNVPIHRRSFLYAGAGALDRVRSDEDVDLFMVLVQGSSNDFYAPHIKYN